MIFHGNDIAGNADGLLLPKREGSTFCRTEKYVFGNFKTIVRVPGKCTNAFAAEQTDFPSSRFEPLKFFLKSFGQLCKEFYHVDLE